MAAPEIIEFPTFTPSGFDALMAGRGAATDARVTGDLHLPANAAGSLPLVIVSIGSHGLTSGREALYAGALTAAGMAVLIVDSYTARGFAETISDQGRLPFAASAADALYAARHMLGDKRFDPKRVALLGYSRGGSVSLMSWDERLQSAVLGGARLAAHVALYAPTYMRWANPRPPASPMLLLLGGRDELAPARDGEAYARHLEAVGGKIEVITFPQARHSFDAAFPAQFSAASMVLAASEIRVNDSGEMREMLTGVEAGSDWAGFLRRLGELRGRRGAVTGHGPLPRDIAVAPIAAFLRRALGLG